MKRGPVEGCFRQHLLCVFLIPPPTYRRQSNRYTLASSKEFSPDKRLHKVGKLTGNRIMQQRTRQGYIGTIRTNPGFQKMVSVCWSAISVMGSGNSCYVFWAKATHALVNSLIFVRKPRHPGCVNMIHRTRLHNVQM